MEFELKVQKNSVSKIAVGDSATVFWAQLTEVQTLDKVAIRIERGLWSYQT